jgi:hypothetical protein
MTRAAFVEVYRPANHAELALLRPALEQAGIRFFVKNEFASMGARSATGADELSLMVEAMAVGKARKIIDATLHGEDETSA